MSVLKDRSQYIIQNETQRHKDKKYRRGSKRHRKYIEKTLHAFHWNLRRETENETKALFEETIAKIILELMKYRVYH